MICPECHLDSMVEREGRFPICEECGYEQYDQETLALIAEVKREQAQCKAVLGYVPTYPEAIAKGLIKP